MIYLGIGFIIGFLINMSINYFRKKKLINKIHDDIQDVCMNNDKRIRELLERIEK